MTEGNLVNLSHNPIFQQLIVAMLVAAGSWYTLLKEVDYVSDHHSQEIVYLKDEIKSLGDEVNSLGKEIVYLEGKLQLKTNIINTSTVDLTVPDTVLQSNYITDIATN